MEEANLSELDDVEFDTPINQAIAVLQVRCSPRTAPSEGKYSLCKK
jgi:hypothetical protein